MYAVPLSIGNTQQLLTELQNTTEYNQNLRLASFDITNMYTNIPTSNIPPIIEQICKYQNTPKEITREINKIVRTILKQNYFTFDNNVYKQIDGLAMGTPTSALFSEIYLQKMEHTKLITILANNNIRNYIRYVDDILIVYDVTITDITAVLNQFNSITTNLQFTIEH
jgi:flagellin-like hook-associated protein FlgL